MAMDVVACQELFFSYSTDTPVLSGVDLSVEQGELVALLGPSGSGKSSLLLCLAGILVPSSGRVLVNGVRVDRLNDRGRTLLRRTAMGFVLQSGQLVPELTVLENAGLPLRLTGASRGEADRRAREFLDRVGVSDLVHRRVTTLSGGQQQRVAVARALVHRPTVIFADEPTGALDSVNGETVTALLLGAAREEGSAVIMVTHDENVAAHADRRVLLRDGRVVGDDRPTLSAVDCTGSVDA